MNYRISFLYKDNGDQAWKQGFAYYSLNKDKAYKKWKKDYSDWIDVRFVNIIKF